MDEAVLMRIAEKQGDVALRLGRVNAAIDAWQHCLDYHRGQEDLERVADLHRKMGSGLSHKGERKAAIEHYQKGINLLKDGPARLELVRLYEEAAWLYLHTGDNMLAIYASEKALRLAERLGETRAASRAHGIFGRVFGRIGDTEKARSNLERSVELARGSDHGETILALLALGRHFEISEAETDRASEAYTEALALAKQVGDLPSQVELHAALAQLAVYRADWEQVEESTAASAELAEREGLVGKLCLPFVLRALLRWRSGEHDGAEQLFRRAHELAEQVGWSELAFSALYGLAITLRDRGDLSGAVTALDQATDVCERAGLIAQSIQATAERAVVLALAGRIEQARESAEEAAELADRLHYPVGRAASLEAQGATAEDAGDAIRLLAEARDAWTALRRPLEASRCDLVAALVLAERDPAEAERARERAAEEYETLGVAHLARQAREPAALRLSSYCVRSVPVITTTLASPAIAWLSGSIASRWSMPSLRPTAIASRSAPSVKRTTDSLRAPWSALLSMLPATKPLASTRSAIEAARPGIVVPLRTATVTSAGLTGAGRGSPSPPSSPAAATGDGLLAGGGSTALIARELHHAEGRRHRPRSGPRRSPARGSAGSPAGADASAPPPLAAGGSRSGRARGRPAGTAAGRSDAAGRRGGRAAHRLGRPACGGAPGPAPVCGWAAGVAGVFGGWPAGAPGRAGAPGCGVAPPSPGLGGALVAAWPVAAAAPAWPAAAATPAGVAAVARGPSRSPRCPRSSAPWAAAGVAAGVAGLGAPGFWSADAGPAPAAAAAAGTGLAAGVAGFAPGTGGVPAWASCTTLG